MIGFNREDIFLVTGASSGIGAAVALHLNKLGATVIASGRSQERLEEVKGNASQADFYHCETRDLGRDIDDLPSWVMGLKKKYGQIGRAHV